jgi:hypothetical protein
MGSQARLSFFFIKKKEIGPSGHELLNYLPIKKLNQTPYIKTQKTQIKPFISSFSSQKICNPQ